MPNGIRKAKRYDDETLTSPAPPNGFLMGIPVSPAVMFWCADQPFSCALDGALELFRADGGGAELPHGDAGGVVAEARGVRGRDAGG